MNLFDMLNLARENAGTILKQGLEREIAAFPDSAPLLQPLLDIGNQSITAEGVAQVVAALPAEVTDILRGHFERRVHAGDAN